MKWEQCIIAISLPIIVILVVLQTLGIFGALDAGLGSWLERWQALVAAIIAVIGVGWQVSRQGWLARMQMEEARDLASSAQNAERLAVARAVQYEVVQVLVNSAFNKGAMAAFRAEHDHWYVDDVIGQVWRKLDTPKIVAHEPLLGRLGSIAYHLWLLVEYCRASNDVISRAQAVPSDELYRAFIPVDFPKVHLEHAWSCQDLADRILLMFSEEFPSDLPYETLDLSPNAAQGERMAARVIENCRRRADARIEDSGAS